MCVCMCVCARARVCVRACACTCVPACVVCACVRDVFAIYDNNTLPRLIMIIIKIIILHFIQIRHTDDFPSTGVGSIFNGNKQYYKVKSVPINFVIHVTYAIHRASAY